MSQIGSKFPFDSAREDRVLINGEATSMTAGKLVFCLNDTTGSFNQTASGKPIGQVGVLLQTTAAAAQGRVRFLGRVTAGDLSTGVFDTTAMTAAGDTATCAAAGAMATWATAAERRVGHCVVKSATVGEFFVNGFIA